MHMTGDEKLLVKSEYIRSVLIDLPNSTQTVSTKQGSVAMGEKFKLSKVLFVPNLSCNLVSVAKITKELNCTVTFFDNSCILQDRI